MTFTEAAVEILHRAGKPLHFKEIAQEALTAGLLSHIGQTPEATMGARLLALARREHDRKVVATETGVFALAEWGLVPQDATQEALETPADDALPYRSRERHPPLQEGIVLGARRDERRRGPDEEPAAHKHKRFPPPAEVAYTLLSQAGERMALADLAKALREKGLVAEALERDPQSLKAALEEENRRRKDTDRPPAFDFGPEDQVRALEMPKERRAEKPSREEKDKRAPARAAFVEEERRHVLRQVRRRLCALDLAALERAAVALLDAQGYRELNLVRRSVKEGPLYLARRKWGSGELRYVVRVFPAGREIARAQVQELRRDLARYSAQLGIAFATGECSREAKSEGNLPGTAPVLLYGAEAFGEALVETRLGVHERVLEVPEYDDAFFASLGGGEAPAEVDEVAPEPPKADEAPERAERGRRSKERERRKDSVKASGSAPDETPRDERLAAPAPPASEPGATEGQNTAIEEMPAAENALPAAPMDPRPPEAAAGIDSADGAEEPPPIEARDPPAAPEEPTPEPHESSAG